MWLPCVFFFRCRFSYKHAQRFPLAIDVSATIMIGTFLQRRSESVFHYHQIASGSMYHIFELDGLVQPHSRHSVEFLVIARIAYTKLSREFGYDLVRRSAPVSSPLYAASSRLARVWGGGGVIVRKKEIFGFWGGSGQEVHDI
jgi:hypothetical protein